MRAREWFFVGVVLGLVLVTSPSFAQELKPTSRPSSLLDDERPLEESAPRNRSIEIAKWLQEWSARLGILVLVDPQLEGRCFTIMDCETSLTWGLAKKILDLEDVVLDEREVRGRWVLFAHFRRNCVRRGLPTPPPPFTPGLVVTSILQVKHGAGNDIFASIRGLLTRDQDRWPACVLYVRGPEVFVIHDFESVVAHFTKVVGALDQAGPGEVTRILPLAHARAEVVAAALREAAPRETPGSTPSSLARVEPVEASNTVFVTGSPGDVEAADAIIRDLDSDRWTLRRWGHQMRARLEQAGVGVDSVGWGCAGLVALVTGWFWRRARRLRSVSR